MNYDFLFLLMMIRQIYWSSLKKKKNRYFRRDSGKDILEGTLVKILIRPNKLKDLIKTTIYKFIYMFFILMIYIYIYFC